MKPPSASITTSIRIRNLEHAFSTSTGVNSGNTRRMAAIRLDLMLWEVMLVMFSTYTKQSSPAGSGREGSGASERTIQSHCTPSEAKPGSLWTYGLAPSPAATPRVCHRPPNCTRGSPHSSAHPSTLWCWLSSRLRRCEVAWYDLPLHHLQRVVRCVELCPQAFNRPDFHFEGASNGPVVITRIGRKHELYSGASPISLVEHCVTFRHNRRLLSLIGFIHNWPTSRWSETKKENRFSFNGNGIMSFFLSDNFIIIIIIIIVSCC